MDAGDEGIDGNKGKQDCGAAVNDENRAFGEMFAEDGDPTREQ